MYKNYIMYSPVNGKVEDGTERPLWLPPDKKATPKAEPSLDFEVAFGDGKTVHIPDEIADVERWKAFASGEHTARLKGNQLVITKREDLKFLSAVSVLLFLTTSTTSFAKLYDDLGKLIEKERTTMRKLNIGILDLVAKGPTRNLWARTIHANLASIMPQAIATWCEEEGHTVTYVCYTGLENPLEEFPKTLDVLILGTFSYGAQLAYALSNFFRSTGAVTVLGGSHARCYPQDAQKYFDYVLGFTDRTLIRDLLQSCSPQRPIGIHLSANGQPKTLPGVRERWKFIELSHRKAPWIKSVPMLGSMGCPYTCSFCIDSVIPYQPLEFDPIKADLQFLLGKFKRPIVAWHDPNFGIRFDDYLSAIEAAVPPGSIDFIAESSLSVLSEAHMKRLKHNGFKGLLPGIESWQDFGNKSKTGKHRGIDKVQQVSEQVNMIRRYVPYVQTNFVFGLDIDEGPEPFELTKRFLEMTPGLYPACSLLTAYGQAAPLNLEY